MGFHIDASCNGGKSRSVAYTCSSLISPAETANQQFVTDAVNDAFSMVEVSLAAVNARPLADDVASLLKSLFGSGSTIVSSAAVKETFNGVNTMLPAVTDPTQLASNDVSNAAESLLRPVTTENPQEKSFDVVGSWYVER
ncbi:hypothetical protein LTR17_017029 [Elasticomyces elasticus]|nr:hypothetical protein LTR17_017029 [Elasticomyces elasticus]